MRLTPMDIKIPDKELERLACDASYKGGYPERIVAMFRQTLQIVAAVSDESVLAQFKCLCLKKTRPRGVHRTLALTEDADLVVRIQNGKPRPEMIVERIRCNGRNKK